MQFKAAVLHQPMMPLVMENVTLMSLQPDDVLVRLQASGLYHTYLEVINGD